MPAAEDITLREYIERLFDERDRLYTAKIQDVLERLDLRITAVETAFKTALNSSDKAIDKAENAQREYNIRSNEFRGQLDDQAKTLMPRSEANVAYAAIVDKLDSIWKTYEERHEILL